LTSFLPRRLAFSQFFQAVGLPIFVGHPLRDAAASFASRNVLLHFFGLLRLDSFPYPFPPLVGVVILGEVLSGASFSVGVSAPFTCFGGVSSHPPPSFLAFLRPPCPFDLLSLGYAFPQVHCAPPIPDVWPYAPVRSSPAIVLDILFP